MALPKLIETAKKSLSEVLEELCPGVGRRNRPAWATPLPLEPALPEPMMTTDEDAVPEPVSTEGAAEYVKRTQPPVRAIRWTGGNLEDVRKVFPGLNEEYMRDKGCRIGDYVVCPCPGKVRFWDAREFEQTYQRVAAPIAPAAVSDRIAEIESRLAAITPGPWRVLEVPRRHEWESAKSFIGAVPYEGHPYKGHTRYFDVLGDEDYPTKASDQKFIAAAPDDIRFLLDQLRAQPSAEKDARIAELETVLNRTVTVVNELPSVTGLSPVRDYSGVPLAVADLQECYRDAARARNGLYTKMQARAESAEAKLRAAEKGADAEADKAAEMFRSVISAQQENTDHLLRQLAEANAALHRERSVWCDKPDDRLYHAADKTWWKRSEDGSCVKADPPPDVSENRELRYKAEEALADVHMQRMASEANLRAVERIMEQEAGYDPKVDHVITLIREAIKRA